MFDTSFLELSQAAEKLVKVVLNVKEGEEVAVVGDTLSDIRVIEETAKAVFAAGGIPVVVIYHTQPVAQMEPPGPAAAAIRNADVFIEFTVQYILYTEARRQAVEDCGTRYICLAGMDADSLIRNIGQVDYVKMVELGDVLVRLTRDSKEMRITCPNGTDLTAVNEGRRVEQSGRLAHEPGQNYMLGGQVGWNPIEETINGTLVFDGTMFPPETIQELMTPVKLTIEKGIITGIDGGKEAEIFEKFLAGFDDPKMYRIAHFCYGFNPGAQLGNIAEAERVVGCLNVGMGASTGGGDDAKGWTAASHTDGTTLKPTIRLDGELLEKDGVYVHPEIVELVKGLIP